MGWLFGSIGISHRLSLFLTFKTRHELCDVDVLRASIIPPTTIYERKCNARPEAPHRPSCEEGQVRLNARSGEIGAELPM